MTMTNEFVGEALTQSMEKYGFTRKSKESDWDFRKRVFPSLFLSYDIRAVEFLYGCKATDWDEVDCTMYRLYLDNDSKFDRKNPNNKPLEEFADFPGDPIEMREKRKKKK